MTDHVFLILRLSLLSIRDNLLRFRFHQIQFLEICVGYDLSYVAYIIILLLGSRNIKEELGKIGALENHSRSFHSLSQKERKRQIGEYNNSILFNKLL